MAKLNLDVSRLELFDCDRTAGIAIRWQTWVRTFELYYDGMGIAKAEQKRALFLHCVGVKVQEVFFTLTETMNIECVYKHAKTALNSYFVPKTTCRMSDMFFVPCAKTLGKLLNNL